MTIKEREFVEIDYTGKLADGTVFDTTVESVAKGNKLPSTKFGPAIICVGEKQLLPGLDDALVGKELGKEYSITLAPENAFGKKDIKKLKIVPINVFKENNLRPQPGLQINVDGEMGIVTRVSGGRVIVNFNHQLAGREVIYTFTVHKKVTDTKEQLIAFLNTTFQIDPSKMVVEIKDDKAEIKLPTQLPQQFTDLVSKKLAELVKLKEVVFSS